MTQRILLFALVCIIAGPLAAQTRFDQSLSVSGGLYAASGIGTNSYLGVRYDYYILGGRFFIEASLGGGSLDSKVLASISKARLFSSNSLVTYEFSVAYDAIPAGSIPFVLFGVAGVRQGEQTSFAGVVGLGKRIPLPGLFGTNAFGFRYDIRDQIFSQQLNTSDSFIVHNIVATLGFQVYF